MRLPFGLNIGLPKIYMRRIPRAGDQIGGIGGLIVTRIWACGNSRYIFIQGDDEKTYIAGPCDTSMCRKFDRDLRLCVLKNVPETEKSYEVRLYEYDRNIYSIGKIAITFSQIGRIPGFVQLYMAKDYDDQYFLIIVKNS